MASAVFSLLRLTAALTAISVAVVGISAALAACVHAQVPEPIRAGRPHRAPPRRRIVIWGMPAVNYDLMLPGDGARPGGEPNQIVYWSRLLDWKNQTLTPNPDVDLPHAVLQHEGGRTGGDGDPAGRRRLDHRQHRRRLADGAGGCRSGRRGQGQGRQISDPAARLQGRGARRLHRPAVARPITGYALLRSISRAAATPTSPRRSPMASGSSSIRCRRRPIRRRPTSSTRSTSSSTAPSPTTCASSSRSTASCSASPGWSATRR